VWVQTIHNNKGTGKRVCRGSWQEGALDKSPAQRTGLLLLAPVSYADLYPSTVFAVKKQSGVALARTVYLRRI
jgi:hypothetical protein